MAETMEKETQTVLIGVLERKVEEWLSWDKNEDTRAEITQLHNEAKTPELMQLLMGRMEFGTAGLRGRMGAGYTQMNDLVIIQTTQGIAKYLLKQAENRDTVKEAGVVVGFDGRHNSQRFAALTATVLASQGFRVYLFSELCPTPFVPFCVTSKKCAAGIMVTASHNPKEDNGYKVYWDNGAQIIPPHDKLIQAEILLNLEPWPESWDIDILTDSKLVSDPLVAITAEYMDLLDAGLYDKAMNQGSTVRIVYTAMHGVGYAFMKTAFKIAKLRPFFEVKEQIYPDPDFPTVKFPNPEEGKSALDLAIATANSTLATLILANDPDADRLAAAEKITDNHWRIYTGNELGALLGWWALTSYKSKNPGADLTNCYMLASTVSSKFLRSMAEKEGFQFVETLTGFKWMGNTAVDLIAKGHTVLFAFEEAIGYMWGTGVLDKDGISAGVHLAELAAYLEINKMSLDKKLDKLYEQYGYHLCDNSYFHCYNPATLKQLFENIRNNQGEGSYPQSLKKGKFKVSGVRDLTTGYDSTTSNYRAVLPSSSSSQMITFTFNNGAVVTLRTSGTEPKVKYYLEVVSADANLRRIKAVLAEMVASITEELLMPQANGLIARRN